jgi:hypothetical protein
MAYRTMEKLARPEVTFFRAENPGDCIWGRPVLIKEITTKYGVADVLMLEDPEGEQTQIILSSNLLHYDFESLIAMDISPVVRITYLGDEKNPKSGKYYKVYLVEVDDGEPEPLPAAVKQHQQARK